MSKENNEKIKYLYLDSKLQGCFSTYDFDDPSPFWNPRKNSKCRDHETKGNCRFQLETKTTLHH